MVARRTRYITLACSQETLDYRYAVLLFAVAFHRTPLHVKKTFTGMECHTGRQPTDRFA